MPFSGGNYSAPSNSWNPAVTGTTINATDWATLLADLSTALSTCVLKDGSQTVTGNLPMSGFKLTGLSAGSTSGDSVRYEQVLLLTGGTMTGDILFTDATYDIGKSGATRPRDGFFSRNGAFGGTLAVTGHTTFEGVTSTGATGTGKLVYDTSPVIALNTASTAATQTAGDNSTKVATTGYVENYRITLATEQASTSGTAIDFTSIPAGVRRIVIMLVATSTSGTSNVIVQIGAGSVASSGYTSYATTASGGTSATSSAGFMAIVNNTGASAFHGRIELSLENASNGTWVAITDIYDANANTSQGMGSKTLSGTLDRVRITTAGGTDTFDAGVINISYQY